MLMWIWMGMESFRGIIIIMYTAAALYPYYVYPGPFIQFMADLLLFSLFVFYPSWLDRHLCVCACAAALGECAGVDHRYAVYYLCSC